MESVFPFSFCVVREGIFFVAPRKERVIQFLDFSSRTTRSVAELEKPLKAGLSMSPDGRYLLYAQIEESDSDLMLVENFR